MHGKPPPAGADARFRACLDVVLPHEGGFVDDPEDPGGATKFGISLRAAQGFGSLADVDHDGDVDRSDILELTVEDAAGIYRAQYWTTLRCDEIPAGLDLMLFDFGVNAGPTAAVRLLQGALAVKVDGVIGPKTLAAVRAADRPRAIDAMATRRQQFYRSLAKFPRFGRGWLRRTEEVRLVAQRMVSGPQA